MGFELQQLGEGFPAMFAAQGLRLLAKTVFLPSAPRTLELY